MSFFAAPTMVKRLADDRAIAGADLTHLKTIIYGGAPMYLADLEDALAVFGPRLAQIYGQGESPMTITGLSKADHADRDHPRWRDHLQSVGVSRTDVEVRVVDDGCELPAGEIGEVVVRGDVVMAGYWHSPDATAEALRGGWLYTGDIGSFDADGYLTLRDRSKDLIISGGMNICPREVEEALLRHPGVRAAAVVGRPDAEWGEAVVAFVVAADRGAEPGSTIWTGPASTPSHGSSGPRTTASSVRCPQQLRQGGQAGAARQATGRNGQRRLALRLDPGRAAAKLDEDKERSRPLGRPPGPCNPPPYLRRRRGTGRGVLVNRWPCQATNAPEEAVS